MYCLKHFPHESPMRVHAVASKYVCTQLQVSAKLHSAEARNLMSREKCVFHFKNISMSLKFVY